MSKSTYTGNISQASHTYTTQGNHNLKIDDAITTLAIGNSSSSNDTITSFKTTGENLKSLGNYCFYGMHKLSSVTSDSVLSTGTYCFRYCYNLESIDLPNLSSMSNMYSFTDNNKLTSIHVDNPVLQSIDNNTAVRNVSTGDLIFIAPGITEYSNSQVTSMNAYASSYNGMISALSLPNIKTMGMMAVRNCSSLVSLDISSLEEVGSLALAYLDGISSFYLPKLKKITGTSFRANENLVSIDLPSLTSTVPANCFGSCTSLTSFHVPELTNILNSFIGDSNLSVIDFHDRKKTTIPTLGSIAYLTAYIHEDYKVLVPSSLYDSWIAATNWSSIKSHIVAV